MASASPSRPLAIVTGASTGIGYELAKCCARNGFDLIVAADEPRIQKAAEDFRAIGATVTAVQADLATRQGVDRALRGNGRPGRPVDALLANAGRGLGQGFLDQDFEDVRHVIDTNVTGTLDLHPEGWAGHAGAWQGPHPDHRVDRRLHARAHSRPSTTGRRRSSIRSRSRCATS